MAHDAGGGVDGDGLLLDWLLAHGFIGRGPVSCRAGSGRIRVGREQSMEEGPSLGGGEGGRGGVGVGGRDRHDEKVGRWDWRQRMSKEGLNQVFVLAIRLWVERTVCAGRLEQGGIGCISKVIYKTVRQAKRVCQ